MKKEQKSAKKRDVDLFSAGKKATAFLFSGAAEMLTSRAAAKRFAALGKGLEKLYRTARKTVKNYVENGLFDVEDIPKRPAPQAARRPVPAAPEQAPAAAPKAPQKEPPIPTANNDLALFDAQENPALYEALLARQKQGETQLIIRYRRSFESYLIQSKNPIPTYYNSLKNALLHYKNVKSRTSFFCETFHHGRDHIAKLIVKTSCLYIYLSIDPNELKGTKYETAIGNASDRKKFGTFPTVIKVKGERKFKYALELIDRICGEKLQLKLNKKYREINYIRPYQTDEELVKAGLIKRLVAEVKTAEGEAAAE